MGKKRSRTNGEKPSASRETAPSGLTTDVTWGSGDVHSRGSEPGTSTIPAGQPIDVDLLRTYLARIASAPHEISPVYAGRCLADIYVPPYFKTPNQAVAWATDFPDQQTTSWEGICMMAERDFSAWRAVLVGESGSGKSTTLTMTAARIAHTALRLLDNGIPLADVPIPICLKLDNLAEQAFFPVHKVPLEALREAVQANLTWQPAIGHDERLPRAITDLIGASQTLLLLDGLEHVCDHAALERVFFALEESLSRVVITSREYALRLVPPSFSNQYKLLPFDLGQVDAFVCRWFPVGAKRKRVLQILACNPQIQQMATNPLGLSLLCAGRERHELDSDVRLTQLYDLLLRDLLKEDRAVVWMPCLAEVAFTLFKDNCRQTTMEMSRLIQLLRESPNRPLPIGKDMSLNLHEKCDRLVAELYDSRLLFRSGPAEYAFFHKSIIDYLAAWHLARQIEDHSGARESYSKLALDLVDQKSWLPECEQVVVFCAGLLDDPTPLLQRLADVTKDDECRLRLARAAKCLGEIAASKVPDIESSVDEITSAIVPYLTSPNDIVLNIGYFIANQIRPVMERLNGHYEGTPLLDWLARGLQASDDDMFEKACRLLKALPRNSVTPRLFDALLHLLNRADSPLSSRSDALCDLVCRDWSLADPNAVDLLIAELRKPNHITSPVWPTLMLTIWIPLVEKHFSGNTSFSAFVTKPLFNCLYNHFRTAPAFATLLVNSHSHPNSVGPLIAEWLLSSAEDNQLDCYTLLYSLAALGDYAALPTLLDRLLNWLQSVDGSVAKLVWTVKEALASEAKMPAAVLEVATLFLTEPQTPFREGRSLLHRFAAIVATPVLLKELALQIKKDSSTHHRVPALLCVARLGLRANRRDS